MGRVHTHLILALVLQISYLPSGVESATDPDTKCGLNDLGSLITKVCEKYLFSCKPDCSGFKFDWKLGDPIKDDNGAAIGPTRIVEGKIPLLNYGVVLSYGGAIVGHWDDVQNKMVFIQADASNPGVLTIEGCLITIGAGPAMKVYTIDRTYTGGTLKNELHEVFSTALPANAGDLDTARLLYDPKLKHIHYRKGGTWRTMKFKDDVVCGEPVEANATEDRWTDAAFVDKYDAIYAVDKLCYVYKDTKVRMGCKLHTESTRT
jgi:hypothetical protein